MVAWKRGLSLMVLHFLANKDKQQMASTCAKSPDTHLVLCNILGARPSLIELRVIKSSSYKSRWSLESPKIDKGEFSFSDPLIFVRVAG